MTLSGVVENKFFHNYKFVFNHGINIVVGNNGTGKTTLLKTICGIKRNKGHIMLNEKRLRKDTYAYFFSGDKLGEDEMSIKETIFYYMNSKRTLLIKEYEALMTMLNLKQHEDVLVKNASEGMKQKMNIIICLLNRRSVVLLDEPFNYLDEKACSSLIHYLQEYQRKCNNIIIISTNDLRLLSEFDSIKIIDLNKMKIQTE